MPFLSELARRKRLKLIKKEINKSDKILDCGCGDMWLTNHLVGDGYDCIGMDLHNFNSKDYTRGSACRIPFPDKCFDVVIMIEVIEHVCEVAYEEIKRVCKKKIILTTPNGIISVLFLEMLAKIGLIVETVTPHINIVKDVKKLPFGKLVEEKTILLLDKYAVFEVEE